MRAGAHLLGLDTPEVVELPADVVRAVPLASYSDGLTTGKHALASLSLIAASARSAPELLYLPRAFEREFRQSWQPSWTEQLLDRVGQFELASRAPAVRVARPGPNPPCGCGSGRKYKKCCGSPSAAQR